MTSPFTTRKPAPFRTQLAVARAMSARVIQGVLVGLSLCIALSCYQLSATLKPELGWPALDHVWFDRVCIALLSAGALRGVARAVAIGLAFQRANRADPDTGRGGAR